MADTLEHRTSKGVAPGLPYPLGATLVGTGVNFALYSKHADQVFLLLFDAADGDPTDVIRLDQRTKYVWHAMVQGIGPGQLYAYKVRGEYRPAQGFRFNEHKLLLDPYARALTGPVRNRDNLLLAYDPSPAGGGDLSLDARDNTAVVPKCIVVDDAFEWQGDASPDVALESLVIYEVHAKGFTAHPSSRVEHPGTYLGFVEKIPHLVSLGVNAVELLPVHEFYVDDFLVARGLTNYWGYNSIGFFAPTSFYGTGRTPGCQVAEFKTLVRALHRAGLKVLLDVVYNHTGEGNERGPTISFRGIDNPSYYALTGPPDEPGRSYMNWTGCGNSLQFDDRAVIRLVMDSLAVLGGADARRRLPLRPGVGARAGRSRRRLPVLVGVLRCGGTGSRAPARHPGGGALGPGYLPGGQLPGRLVRVERALPGHDPALHQGRRRPARGRRLAAHRIRGPVRRGWPIALQQHQLHHLPRRLHPVRPRLLRRQAQRAERRGQPRRLRRQQLVELRRRGADERSGRAGPAQEAREELRPLAPDGLRHAHDARRRRVPALAAGEQQRLLPGQRDQLVRLGGRGTERRHGRLLAQGDRDDAPLPHPATAKVSAQAGSARRPSARPHLARHGPAASALERFRGPDALRAARRRRGAVGDR